MENNETVTVACWACFQDMEVPREKYEADKERGLKKHYCSSHCAYLDLM
jgi:hypothetical protein